MVAQEQPHSSTQGSGPASGTAAPRRAISGNWGWFLLRGVLATILGVLAILFPFSAVFGFTMLFAAWAAADGLVAIVAGVRGASSHQDRWWALVLRGLLGLALGILFIVLPLRSTMAYAWALIALLTGWALITGVLEIAAAFRLRKEIEGEWLLGLSGLISIIFGLAVLFLILPNPAATLISAAWLIGWFALIGGIVSIMLAFRLRGHHQRGSGAQP